MADPRKPGSVTIGNVTGGIHSSIIAGGDVVNASAGDSTTAPGNVEEFKQLLLDLHQALSAVAAQQEALRAISPSAAMAVQGAALNVKDVADRVTGDIKPEDATTLRSRLLDASTLLAGVLTAGAAATHSAADIGATVRPVLDMLGPLADKLGVAATWIAKAAGLA
jgi:hypothetical protein